MKMPELPKLPEAIWIPGEDSGHSDEAMRAYAIQYGEAVREACAKVCEELLAFDMDDPGSTAAAAIRKDTP